MLILRKQTDLPTKRVCDFGNLEVITVHIALSVELTYTSVVSRLFMMKQAGGRFADQLAHHSVFVLGEHALKNEVQLPCLPGPTLPVGILKDGTTGVPRGGYTSFLLPEKDSRGLKKSDGYILLCLNHIWFCCF